MRVGRMPEGKTKWKYNFTLVMKSRDLQLWTRTKFDMMVWLKAFDALFRITKENYPQLVDLNPIIKDW